MWTRAPENAGRGRELDGEGRVGTAGVCVSGGATCSCDDGRLGGHVKASRDRGAGADAEAGAGAGAGLDAGLGGSCEQIGSSPGIAQVYWNRADC